MTKRTWSAIALFVALYAGVFVWGMAKIDRSFNELDASLAETEAAVDGLLADTKELERLIGEMGSR